MGLQGELNKEALQMLPTVALAIRQAAEFEGNQIACLALRKILSSRIPLVSLTDKDIKDLETEILDASRFHGWL